MASGRRASTLLAGLALAALAACGDDGGAGPDAGSDAGPDDAAIDAPESQCAREPCSILPQCGCDDTAATPVCDLDFGNPGSGTTECRAGGAGGESTTCSEVTQCAAEHLCIGRCLRYCTDDDDCPGPGGLCILPVLFNGAPIPGVMTCTTDCAPSDVASPSCPAGWGCHLYREAGGNPRWLTSCERPPATGGALGDACETNAGCGPGLDCFNDGSGMGRRCTPSCLCPGGDCAAGVCPAGSGTCHGYTPAALVGTATYGRCFI